MAIEITIRITSESSARQWQNEVRHLNEEVKELLQRTGEAIKKVGENAQGEFVEKAVQWGKQLCDAATKVFEGMEELYNLVDGLLKGLMDLIEKNTGVVGKAIAAIDKII